MKNIFTSAKAKIVAILSILFFATNVAQAQTINATGVFTSSNGVLIDSVTYYSGDPITVTMTGSAGTNHTDVNFSGATSRAVRLNYIFRFNNNNGLKKIIMIVDLTASGSSNPGLAADYKQLRKYKGEPPGTTWTVVSTATQIRFGSHIYIYFPVDSVKQSTDFEYAFGSTDSLISPLPVKFVDFNATKQNDGKVKCEWSTASEYNSDYFEIQSSDNTLDWVSIGSVPASHYSYNLKRYQFTSEDIVNKKYYRIKEVDFDRSVDYTTIRSIKLEEPLIKIFPNPSIGKIIVEGKNILTILIINSSGQTVLATNTKNIDFSEFPDGMYTVQIVSGYADEIKSYRVVKRTP